MKINPKILSIPPYISTSWKNVISLHLEGQTLIIGLVNGSTIDIPGLETRVLESVFASHAKYLELEASGNLPMSGPSPSPVFPPNGSAVMGLPFQIGIDGDFGTMMQHNSEAADSPNLPPEMLEKIVGVTKAMGINNIDELPKPEPHCNCPHCQIMRAMREEPQEELIEEEDEVTDADLTFREWDIEEMGSNLFSVANPLNRDEKYSVFLSNPVGCTCGKPNCEHIKAVLNS